MSITDKRRIGNKEVSPFTIPSGIVTTSLSCLERIAYNVPEVGILTTKSIGPEPRTGNREPILAQLDHHGGYINAVGLTNPGADAFAKELANVKLPEDKFLLASIFGKNEDEFVAVAKKLAPHADGLELNLSCPHAKGYGMQLGQDPAVVRTIVQAVVQSTKVPVFAKLTPNASNIGEIAKAAVAGGAYGITAINTVGPGYHSVDGYPVLTNQVGGLSGIGIAPIGLKCVREIRLAVGKDVPIIGMGGIMSARDVRSYASVGANFFGIGTALVGMTERDIANYFAMISARLNGQLVYSPFVKEVNTQYRQVFIDHVVDPGCDFKVFVTKSNNFDASPGQFVFAWLPGVGEKPFSVMDTDPLALGVQERGVFTRKFCSLNAGDSFYVRGPYGQPLRLEDNVVLVGGGCGIAGIYLLAKYLHERSNDPLILLGAKDKAHIPFLDRFEQYGRVKVATEDGSVGQKGFVTGLFDGVYVGATFVNCGPRAMITAVLPIELEHASPEKVFSSMDYMTRCGVGLCGSCANENGLRTCVEGPFMNP